MIRSYFVFLLLFVLVVNMFPKETSSEVTIPWKEFRSLTNLDKDQIILPLETFEKILVQTGKEDIRAYNILDGNVIIEKNEFKKLVDKMKPPVKSDLAVPYDYLITKSIYKGKMREENTNFTATFFVHILKDDKYLKIPLVPISTAVENIKVNGKSALIVSESGYSKVVLQGKGEYKIEVDFSVKSSLKKGPHELYLAINLL